MKKIPFEEGVLITPAKVNEDGTITPAKRTGTTPLSPHVLDLLQDNIEEEIDLNKIHTYTMTVEADTALRSRSRVAILVQSW